MGLLSGIKAQMEKRKEYKQQLRNTESYRLEMERAEAQERLKLAQAKNQVRELKAEARRETFKPFLKGLSNIQGRLKETETKGDKKYYKKSAPSGGNNSPFSNPSFGPGPQGVYNLGSEKGNPWRNTTLGPGLNTTPRASKKKAKGITITINK